jgi:sarcosine oxidase subunit gamma
MLPAQGGDVILEERCGLGIATVMAGAVNKALIADHMALPEGARASLVENTTIIGTGPGTWLVVQEAAEADWAGHLERGLAGVASVADQSSAYAVLRLSGAASRRLLARCAFIDFAPESFGPGAAAVTLVAHMGAIIWQRDGAPTYEIAVFRSFAGSFWHALETAAWGFGARLSRGG